MSHFITDDQISLNHEIMTQTGNPPENQLDVFFNVSINQTLNSFYPLRLNSSRASYSDRSRHSEYSEHTISTKQMNIRKLDRERQLGNIEGLEVQYINLINHNQKSEDAHFSVLNENLRSLLNKKKKKKEVEFMRVGFFDPMVSDLISEVPVCDIRQILSACTQPKLEMGKSTEPFEQLAQHFINDIDQVQNAPNDEEPQEQDAQLTRCVIPDKFKNKKLPYLDKKIKTGFIKFFNDKSNFGFMSLLTEPFGEVFIFGKEFAKSKLEPKLITAASGNPQFVFRFKVMYYMGRHGESKKAVNIRFN